MIEVPNPGQRARRRRGADRPAPRRHRQRDLPSRRRAHGRTANVAGAGGEGHSEIPKVASAAAYRNDNMMITT